MKRQNGLATMMRRAVGSAVVIGTMATAAMAQELTLIGHRVHQMVTTEGAAGAPADEWAAARSMSLNWLTFNVQDVHERLYREASLSTTSIDVGFVANRYFRPQFTEMFAPLDDFLASHPIEAFDEMPQGMLDALTYDGKLYGIPFRHATAALHINTAILAERGHEVPTTYEEVLELARALSFRRDDGTQVHGLLIDFRGPSMISDFARAKANGDFITADFQLLANSPEMIEAVETVAGLFNDGVLPRAFLNFRTEDVITYMQQGRAAMAISPFSRYQNFNNPEQSQVAGNVISIALPASEALQAAGIEAAPVRTEFWAMVIPQNSDAKEAAWDFIREMSSVENTIRAAVNGNGPIRPSAYDDARIQSMVPYWEAEQAALAVARPPFPGFEESARAEDIFIEEFDLVLLGRKTAAQAMEAVQARVGALLP